MDKEEIAILRAWIDQGADFGQVEIKEEATKPVDPRVSALIAAIRSHNDKEASKILRGDRNLAKGVDAGSSTPLHHAAGFGTIATVKALLGAGADVNAMNRFGQTPLHWSFSDAAKVALLLDNGAAIDARTNDGRSTLYLTASQRNSDAAMRLLLERGADPNAATMNGRTPIMAAAVGGVVPYMKLLIAKGAKADAVHGTGGTALMEAASSRNPEAVRLLIEAGVNVNAQTKKRQTALQMAAMYGTEETVKMLLAKGADVNIRDDRGYSPLLYAAYSELAPVRVARMLLDKGADPNVEGEGETPKMLAAKRGDTELARLLGVSEEIRRKGGVAPSKMAGNRTPAEAVAKALEVLAAQSPRFVKTSGCNSCHNQNLPAAAAGMARERGLAAVSITQLPLEFVERSPERAMDLSIGAAVNSLGYEALEFAANRRPTDEYTDAVTHLVKAMQTPAGYWQTTAVRPPLTSDDVITTAMAVNLLSYYGPAAEKADTAKRIARASAWLETTHPDTTQERAFQLLGLGWAKANPSAIEASAKALTATQRPDGGWSQLPAMGSDSYATGQALYALHVAGKVPVNDAVFKKGMDYLLKSQAADGSWHVKTRSLWVQPYFESGFPYGHDQWISAAGTSWAAMALSLAAERPKLSRR
jgi:ankyrin repeat protein